MRALFALTLAVAAAAAGCVTAPSADIQAQSALLGDLKATLTPEFVDAQNAPHPLYNWPTLNFPAEVAPNPYWEPIAAAPLPAPITGIDLLAEMNEEIPNGGGIAIFGSLAVVPGLGDLSFVVDITDPAAPKILSEFEPVQGGHRGAAIIAYPNGQLVAVMATSAGFEAWDISDPTKPVNVAAVEPTMGGHKVGVVPGTPIVYNANSNGGFSQNPDEGTGITEIYDLTDPAAPVHVQDFPNGFGCHHIYFWNNAEKQRAICAGIEFTQIWDTADPLNPVVIVSVPVHHGDPSLPSTSIWTTPGLPPGIFMFSHFGILNDEGNILVVGDEAGGGGFPPGCVANVPTPAGDVSTPFGALWFYDVSVETEPKLLGWFSPGLAIDQNPPTVQDGIGAAFYSCTAHHGRLVPQEDGRDLLAMSFYRSGVVLVDFTNPQLPTMVDQFVTPGQNTWETWYYNGYLFTGDIGRGMDVLSFS